MPNLSEYTFRSSNGKSEVYVREHAPEEEPRAIVQIAHGVAEHIERYDAFAEFLAAQGFLVVGNDHLGHGRTAADERELGFFGDNGGWELVVADMKELHDKTAARYPNAPYFLFGHSMGSFLARTYIIRFRAGLSGCVLSGTGQQGAALCIAGRLVASAEIKKHGADYKSQRLQDMAFGSYNDGFEPKRTVCDWLSRDPVVVDKYVDDPLCGYLPSAGLFRDMMGGLLFIARPANLDRMNKSLPVYFMSGEKDPVGGNGKGVMKAYSSFISAGMQDVTMKLYPEGRHEMLNETNRDEVFRDVLNWLESKI